MRRPAKSIGKGPRSRLVRDPIHGDIQLTAVEAGVIDTRVFQRLRYIRQNGLLHFIFPGAVHTRFAHSIGTMGMAERVFSRFVAILDTRRNQRDIEYVGAVFRLAALLHDVGHCAFSHSSEVVEVRGKPLFGTLRERLTAWGQLSLLERIREKFPKKLDSRAMHEELGLALIERIFEERPVIGLCKSELRADPTAVGRDVQALILGGLAPSSQWTKHATEVGRIYDRAHRSGKVVGAVELDNFPVDLLSVLNSLVSGSLDVDRMDYLIRDSYYCGVPYGRCDIDMLVSNLSIGGARGHLELFLNRKAVDSLDDLLWSRYQLFVQVLNHKANVALATLLSTAIADAIKDGHLDHPTTLSDYLLFTDDHVMSRIHKVCSRGDLETKQYAKTLVDRRLPLHLGSTEDLASKARLRRKKESLARSAGVHPKAVFEGIAESVLLKPGRFPGVRDWNRAKKRYDLRSYEEFSHFATLVPPKRRVLHYYVDRDELPKR